MVHKRVKLMYTYLFGIFIIHSAISEVRKCGNAECEALISKGRTTQKYPSKHKGTLSCSIDEVVDVYGKEVGSEKDMWDVKINHQRGLLPKRFIKEESTFIRDDKLIDVSFPFHKPDGKHFSIYNGHTGQSVQAEENTVLLGEDSDYETLVGNDHNEETPTISSYDNQNIDSKDEPIVNKVLHASNDPEINDSLAGPANPESKELPTSDNESHAEITPKGQPTDAKNTSPPETDLEINTRNIEPYGEPLPNSSIPLHTPDLPNSKAKLEDPRIHHNADNMAHKEEHPHIPLNPDYNSNPAQQRDNGNPQQKLYAGQSLGQEQSVNINPHQQVNQGSIPPQRLIRTQPRHKHDEGHKFNQQSNADANNHIDKYPETGHHQQMNTGDQTRQQPVDSPQQRKLGFHPQQQNIPPPPENPSFNHQQKNPRVNPHQQQNAEVNPRQQQTSDVNSHQQQQNSDVNHQQQQNSDVNHQQQQNLGVRQQPQQSSGNNHQQQQNSGNKHQQQQNPGVNPHQRQDAEVNPRQQQTSDVDSHQQQQNSDVNHQHQQNSDVNHQQQQNSDVNHQQQQNSDVNHQQQRNSGVRHQHQQNSDVNHQQQRNSDVRQQPQQNSGNNHHQQQNSGVNYKETQNSGVNHQHQQNAESIPKEQDGFSTQQHTPISNPASSIQQEKYSGSIPQHSNFSYDSQKQSNGDPNQHGQSNSSYNLQVDTNQSGASSLELESKNTESVGLNHELSMDKDKPSPDMPSEVGDFSKLKESSILSNVEVKDKLAVEQEQQRVDEADTFSSHKKADRKEQNEKEDGDQKTSSPAAVDVQTPHGSSLNETAADNTPQMFANSSAPLVDAKPESFNQTDEAPPLVDQVKDENLKPGDEALPQLESPAEEHPQAAGSIGSISQNVASLKDDALAQISEFFSQNTEGFTNKEGKVDQLNQPDSFKENPELTTAHGERVDNTLSLASVNVGAQNDVLLATMEELQSQTEETKPVPEPDIIGTATPDPPSLYSSTMEYIFMALQPVLGDDMGFLLESEIFRSRMSMGSAALLVIISGTIVMLYLLHLCVMKMSQEAPLLKEMNNIKREMRFTIDENMNLKNSLNHTNDQIQVATLNASDSIEAVALQNELFEAKENYARIVQSYEENLQQVEQERDESTANGLELHKMLDELLQSQKDSTNFQASVDSLQNKLDTQKEKVEMLTTDLSLKSHLNDELRMELKSNKNKMSKLDSQIEQLSSALQEQKNSKGVASNDLKAKELQIKKLEDASASLLKEVDSAKVKIDHLTERGDSLQLTLKDMKVQLNMKDAEILVSKECCKKLQKAGNKNVNLSELFGVIELKRNLKVVEKEADTVQKELSKCQTEREEAIVNLNAIDAQIDQFKLDRERAIFERDDALSKLNVLTDYFKEKESQLTRELESQEHLRIDAEGSYAGIENKIQNYEMELNTSRSKMDTLKSEFEDQQQSYKMQLSNEEKKSHDNWIAARAAERRLEELRKENSQLRQRLTLIGRDDGQMLLHKPVPHRMETNGNVSSPASTDGEINRSAHSPLDLDHLPPLPPGMLPPHMFPGGAPLPPGMLPPHMFPGGPHLPPHPPSFMGHLPPPPPLADRRLPPAGRIASPSFRIHNSPHRWAGGDRPEYSPESDYSIDSDRYSPPSGRYSPTTPNRRRGSPDRSRPRGEPIHNDMSPTSSRIPRRSPQWSGPPIRYRGEQTHNHVSPTSSRIPRRSPPIRPNDSFDKNFYPQNFPADRHMDKGEKTSPANQNER